MITAIELLPNGKSKGVFFVIEHNGDRTKDRAYYNPNPYWINRLISLTNNPKFKINLYCDGWRITRKDY